MKRKLAVARLWYEGSSFNPVPTQTAAFRAREWVAGPRASQLYVDTATEMGAVAAFERAHPDWSVTYLRCTSAPPGGPVAQHDLDLIGDEIIAGLASGGSWEGVYLSLHGALLGTQDLSPDHSLLARVRATIGPDVVLAVSFDMHACINPGISDLVDILCGYRTYPHVDMYQTAARALDLMARAAQGQITPRMTLRPVPMLPNSHLMRTDHGPMAEIISLADAAEATEGVHDVSAFGGFAYADTPHAHASIAICHEPGQDVTLMADHLAAEMQARHARFVPDLPDARTGLAHAAELIAQGTRWPVALVESADNPLSGGLGDTTGLFRALIDSAPDLPVVFCFFHDPGLVARAHAAGEGAGISAALGGRIAPEFGAAVPFDGVVERLTDGRYRNTGPMERGMPVDLGRTAVLRRGNLRVVIAESCQSANDLAWCDLHGINLGRTALFCVKAKNHFRAAFGPVCGAIIDIDTPGPAPADLRRLPFVHVPQHYLNPEASHVPKPDPEPDTDAAPIQDI